MGATTHGRGRTPLTAVELQWEAEIRQQLEEETQQCVYSVAGVAARRLGAAWTPLISVLTDCWNWLIVPGVVASSDCWPLRAGQVVADADGSADERRRAHHHELTWSSTYSRTDQHEQVSPTSC